MVFQRTCRNGSYQEAKLLTERPYLAQSGKSAEGEADWQVLRERPINCLLLDRERIKCGFRNCIAGALLIMS
jgi:hypothetical protein